MRLIFYIPYYRHGGVERVIISLITEISQQIEKVIVVSSANIIKHFRSQITESDKIIYQEFKLPQQVYNFKLVLLNKINYFLKNTFKIESAFTQYLTEIINQENNSLIFAQIIAQHQATHCLYAIGNRINPPDIPIPLFLISYDLFWHFAPLTYAKSFTDQYDQCLLSWLKKSNRIITISAKTRQDILAKFPQYPEKIQAIPLAGFGDNKLSFTDNLIQKICYYFLFPSSFGIYKDHLTLLKAGLILADKNYNFKIILIGKETDKFMKGEVNLSQQKQTQEYSEYLEKWQTICYQNKDTINKHFVGLGFASEAELEDWYQKSDCVIFPSQYEGFGLGISEAIMRGIPVIASDLEVFKEQIDLYKCPDRITFFKKGNADDLATKIADFIDNPKLKLSGEKLKFYQQLWTWEKVAQKYIKIISGDDSC